VPGVQDVAWSSALPLGDSLYGDFALTYQVVGDPEVAEAQRPVTNYQVVSPAYFSTIDLPMVAGRAFDVRDTRDSPRVWKRKKSKTPEASRITKLKPQSSQNTQRFFS
jgi:hypothetical protein